MATNDPRPLTGLNSSKLQDDGEINVLLLGQPGSGKSTLINSVVNYLRFGDLSPAEDKRNKLIVPIPSRFQINNKNDRTKDVRIGTGTNDGNCEFTTRNVKSYVFRVGVGVGSKRRVRLIDSPGIGGLERDAENIDKILDYIGSLEELHAVCLVFRPPSPGITPFFDHLRKILSRLNRSASRNLVFVFTGTRSTNFTPGDTFPLLEKIVDEIRTENDVDILLDENENVFCFENDVFNYLSALRRGVRFSPSQKNDYASSWERSCKACSCLISYIVGDDKRPPLPPYSPRGTFSINESLRLITNLSQPLADVMQLIQDNIDLLQRHRREVSDLKKFSHVPAVDLKVTGISRPVTVCIGPECTANVSPDGEKMRQRHYKRRCHDPCFLLDVQRGIVGDPALVNCDCIDPSSKSCVECGCDLSVHKHVYYFTAPVRENKEGEVVGDDPEGTEKMMEASLEERIKEYEKERETIVIYAAHFDRFVQNHSTINDCCYETYFKYLIKREEDLGGDADQSIVNQMKGMMDRYLDTKQAFEENSQCRDDSKDPETINRIVRELYHLQHTGAKIRELVEKQTAARKNELDHFDTIVDVSRPVDPPEKRNRNRPNFSNRRPGNRSNEPNHPPPPYEPLQQTVQSFCQPCPGPRNGLGIEVTINHQPCVMLPQPPRAGFPGPQPGGYVGYVSGYPGPQSGYPGPQSGYPGPQSNYPGPQFAYPGPQFTYPGPQAVGPQSGHGGPTDGNPGQQQQGSRKFDNRNRQNNRGKWSGGGPKFSDDQKKRENNRTWQPRKDPKFRDTAKVNNYNRSRKDGGKKPENNQGNGGGCQGGSGMQEQQGPEIGGRKRGEVRGRGRGSSESSSDRQNYRRSKKEILIDCLLC